MEWYKIFLQFREVLVAAATGILTWFLSRRKYQASAQIDELTGTEKAITIWRELAEDLSAELEKTKIDMNRSIDDLKKQIQILQEENKELRKILNDMR